ACLLRRRPGRVPRTGARQLLDQLGAPPIQADSRPDAATAAAGAGGRLARARRGGLGAHFFCKLPGDGKEVPWHQDCAYWPLSPSRTVTLWLAIDDADPGNANMQFIPRSHRHGLIGYDESQSDSDVLGLAVAEAGRYGDEAVDVTLRAGQFSLH